MNDVHFGEVEAAASTTARSGPIQRVEPGEPPYPETMNRGAVAEIAAIDPAAVIAKGDLTADGMDEEFAAFEACYGAAFGDRLHVVRGNHDAYRGQVGPPRRPGGRPARRPPGAARHGHPEGDDRGGSPPSSWRGSTTWPPVPTGR